MVKSLNGGAAAHTVLTELDDQKLFTLVVWLRLRVQLHIFLKFSNFFYSIIKIFQVHLSPNEDANKLKANFYLLTSHTCFPE